MNNHDRMYKGFTYTAGWGRSLLWSSWRNWLGTSQWFRWALLSTNQGRSCLKHWSAGLWRSSIRPRWQLCSHIWRSPDRLKEKQTECVTYFLLTINYRIYLFTVTLYLTCKSVCVCYLVGELVWTCHCWSPIFWHERQETSPSDAFCHGPTVREHKQTWKRGSNSA